MWTHGDSKPEALWRGYLKGEHEPAHKQRGCHWNTEQLLFSIHYGKLSFCSTHPTPAKRSGQIPAPLPHFDCKRSGNCPVFWVGNEQRGLCSVNEAERIIAAVEAQHRAAGRAAVRLAL